MSLSHSLWRANQDLAGRALESTFVRGIAAGTLDLSLFQAYIAQDATFLEAFARAYALALAAAPDRDSLGDFAALLAGVVEELQLHDGYAERWGVDPARTSIHPATAEYVDFLRQTAGQGGVGTICAAMTPCMRLYAYIGAELAGEPAAPANPYREWIETYAAPGFEALARRLEALLDRFGTETTAAPAYRRAMEMEVTFFDAFAPN